MKNKFEKIKVSVTTKVVKSLYERKLEEKENLQNIK